MKAEHVGGPSAGTTMPAGKSSEPDAVLRKGLQPKSETVRQAEYNVGAHEKSVKLQVGQDGDPKKRKFMDADCPACN